MDILQIAAIGITGAILALTIKQHKPETALVVAIAAGIIILLPLLSVLEGILERVMAIASGYSIDTGYIAIVFKIIAIAYVCQFSADMCRDAGQSAIASKIEFCARILILFYALPIAERLLGLIVSILP